jgi:hypothetical protein
MSHPNSRRHLKAITRALIEIAFILFLFYANLLMGEFTRGNGTGKTLTLALYDVVTLKNFGIGLASAILGFAFFEYLRKKL